MLTAAKIKQKKISTLGCRKKVKKMPSLAESLRIPKMRESEKNSRIKSTESNKSRSKLIIKNFFATDTTESSVVELRSKPDIKTSKHSNRRYTNNLVSAHKTERKLIDHPTTPLLEEHNQDQILDKNSPSKEITERKFLDDKIIFVSLDFLEDCQKYKKKFIKPMCSEGLKTLRKGLKNISSYRKRYLSSSEQIPKSQKGDGTYKQTISSKNTPPNEIENESSNNLEENKIQKSESSENEVKADVNVKQNKPPEYQNIMNDCDVPDTDIISVNKSLSVKPSSEGVVTVDKKYIELLLSIANCNKTKENINLNDSSERDYGLRQREKKIISGKTFFENKIKKEKPVKHLKSVEETDQKISEKTLHEENNAPIASQESTVLARLVRDMTKSEVQIQHKKNNTTHSWRFSEIQNEKKTAYSKPEVRENRKKRKTRNNVLKNNNEEVIEMPFPSETSKGSDLKELWRRETRNKSENSLSSRSSSTVQEKEEILLHRNSGLDSYKLLRKIVEAEVKTICKKFIEDIYSDQEINIPAEKNSQCDKKSAQLQEVCKELRAMMNEHTSEIFHVSGSKTDEAKLRRKALQEQSLTKEDRKKKDDLLEYLNKCTELEVNLEDKKKKCPSDIVKQWSVLHRLENAFLALGTPSFPSKKPVSKMTRKSDLQKNGKADVKSNEENFYNRSKRLQKKDLSDTKEKKDLLGMKEKKNLLENKAKENLLGKGEKKDVAGNRKEENISGNVKKKNFIVKKEKENLSRNHEQKKMLRNKDIKELIRNKERKIPVPARSNEQNRNNMKETRIPKHPPVSKLPGSPPNKSSERGSKRLQTKEKPQETKSTKNNSSQSAVLISHQKTTAFEDKMKQKKSKLEIRRSVVLDIKKASQRSLVKPKSCDSESKSPKNYLKPKTIKNPVIRTRTLEKTIPEESKADELKVRKPSETTVVAPNWLPQNENENLERKETFDVIPVDVSSKVKAGKSRSCNEMDETRGMNAFKNRFPPTRSAEHKGTHFWDFSGERECKTYGGMYNKKPVLPRKMLVKGKPLRHVGRPKTLGQKDRLRGNRAHKMRSLKYYVHTEKKSVEAVPVEDHPGPNPPEMETTSNRAVKKRSILSMRGSQAQGQNLISLQGKSVNNSPEPEPAEELTDLPKNADITLPTYVPKEAPDSASYSQDSTCTFDLKVSQHDECISNESNPPMANLNDGTTKEAEKPEELSSYSSLSVCTSEQPDIEDDEKEYIKSKKIWERDLKQYRALVKEIMSHYRRIDGFLKENEHSQSFSSDCGGFSSSETSTYKTGKLIGNLNEITLNEYRRKILSEYEALPIFEYKSKIQEKAGNTNLDEKRRNLHFVKPLKTELDIDVKDFKPNMQKILDSELYVDTENLFKRTELLLKFDEKKSSLQEILLNKTGKKVGEEECLRCISTPKAFPLLSRAREYSYSTQSFLTKVNNNGNFGLETVMLKM